MAKNIKLSPLAPKGGFPALPVIDGISFAATAAGVRYSGRDDVMLAQIAPGASIAGVFTTSATRAAPVLDCQVKLGHVADPAKGFGFLVNSGNANAFTGRNGVLAVETVTSAAAAALDIPQSHIYTASTGVIGEVLPADKITDAMDQLVAGSQPGCIEAAARAIMTTDTFAKGATASVALNGAKVSIAGIAKGSGMIAPDMATMLVYIFTDAKIARPVLQELTQNLCDTTFNCITVDSDTSTSDTLLVAATGRAEMPEINDPTDPACVAFRATLQDVMLELAHLVVRDGEGATKFVEIRVNGADSMQDARKTALSIANSPLVKTAIAGEDPNWGRIVMAVGKSGAKADRDRLTIRFGDILVAENGWVSQDYVEADAAAYMKNDELRIDVSLGVGTAQSTVWTCDLTHGYIEINADYRS